ncbi:MAG: hypothetical protein ABJN62_09775 [Halioglobus sp.]
MFMFEVGIRPIPENIRNLSTNALWNELFLETHEITKVIIERELLIRGEITPDYPRPEKT